MRLRGGASSIAISAPGVPGAHNEHCSFLNLGWVAVLLGVELDDALIKLACE